MEVDLGGDCLRDIIQRQLLIDDTALIALSV